MLYEKTLGTGAVNGYVYADGLLITKLSRGTVCYYHQDHHLGGTRLVTEGSQTKFSTKYQPYGTQYGTTGTDPAYKYTGKPQSPVTGLYYYGARWYDQNTGRFLTRDPNHGRLSNPQSQNLCIYVLNNPLRYTDPTGLYAMLTYPTACPAGWKDNPWLSWMCPSHSTTILGLNVDTGLKRRYWA